MRINHNIQALNTYGRLATNTANGSKSLEKLSSGLRINKAGDDAAGLAISEKMRAQIRGLDQAGRNAQDGISMIQTAEGALSETHSILQRMRELADQSANGTNTTEDRGAIQAEIKQLKDEIDRVGNTTEFNTQKLLNGSLQSSGAVAGENVTTSAVVAKLDNASVTAANSITATDFSTLDTTGKDTLTIDGHKIEVDWDVLLSTSDKTLLDKDYSATNATSSEQADIVTAIETALNKAIDTYNSDNVAGAQVAHINVYKDSNDKLVLESGTTGLDSEIFIDTSAGTTVGALYLSSTSGADSTDTFGTSKYSGTTIANNSTIEMQMNGISMKVSISRGTDGYTNNDAMTDVVYELESDVNDAISAYNTSAGKSSGDVGYLESVDVSVTSDGRISIASESGTVSFVEADGENHVENLGLTTAQTEAGGGGGMTFQIGANKDQSINFSISDMRASAIGVANVDVSTQSGASSALTSIDSAIKRVSSERSKMGAIQNRLEHTISNLATSSENLTAAESRVRDVDMAKEMMEFTKNNILTQAAQGMLAQANQAPQGVLQLLR